MDADGRSSCVQIIRFYCAKESELKDKNLFSLEEFILPVNFLKANDIIILSKPRTRDVFPFSGQLWRCWRPQLALLYSKSHIEHRHQKCAHMCSCPIDVAALLVDEENGVASPTQMWTSTMSFLRMFIVCIFLRQWMTRLNKSSWWTRWSLKGHGFHMASQWAKWRNPETSQNQFRQVLELKSTFTKPLDRMEKARRNVEWTTARSMKTSLFWVMKGHTSAQIDSNSKKNTRA